MAKEKKEKPLYKVVHESLEAYGYCREKNLLNPFKYKIDIAGKARSNQFGQALPAKNNKDIITVSSELEIATSFNKDLPFPKLYELLEKYDKVKDFIEKIKEEMQTIKDKFPLLLK